MPGDDAKPSFGSLYAKKTRGRAGAAGASRGLFDPEPAVEAVERVARQPVYAPIVIEAEVAAEAARPVGVVRYTVRQLLGEVRGRVEAAYAGSIVVEGEVSNFRPAASGHLYFTLKDGDAQLAVVMFRRQAGLMGWKLRDGLAVEARGRLSVYETRGQLQMIAETLRPRGEGALQVLFEQLKRRLAAEGLFDAGRKRALPPFPHCIGVVTSATGAALQDIIRVVRRRHARLNLLVYPASVQGANCAGQVAAGVRWFNAHPERVQVILIARGGGSFEDLAGFNDEGLARVIAGSALPVVSAIGHEVDAVIADFVADVRASTPSAAAEMITAAQHRIAERVAGLEGRVRRAGEFGVMRARGRLARLSAEAVLARARDGIQMRQQRVDELRFRLAAAFTGLEARRVRGRANRLQALEARLRRQDPTVRVAVAQRRMDGLRERVMRAGAEMVGRRRARLGQVGGRLEALSPLAVLSRGYSITYGADGGILRSAEGVAVGSEIRTRLADGSLRAVVTSTAAKESDGQ